MAYNDLDDVIHAILFHKNVKYKEINQFLCWCNVTPCYGTSGFANPPYGSGSVF